MTYNFIPSQVSCLDESMSSQTLKYTYPSFVFVARKPCLKENKCYTIAYRELGILQAIELVEGKNRPSNTPPLIFLTKYSKTTLLIL